MYVYMYIYVCISDMYGVCGVHVLNFYFKLTFPDCRIVTLKFLKLSIAFGDKTWSFKI